MLSNLYSLAFAAEETTMPGNLSDSLKTSAIALIDEVKKDPSQFLQNAGQSAIQFGLKVLAAIAIYIIGAWLIKKLKKLLRKIFEKRKTEGAVASFVISLVTIVLTVLLFLVVISTLGINTTSFAALLAAGGMAIGMALSGTVQNFSGGIMILLFKPFKAGDFISAQGYTGTVTDVTIASTKIRTVDNRIVILPNGALSNGNIDNYSALPLRRVDINVSLAYDTDADKAIEAILDIMKSDKRILDAQTPGAADPFVGLSSLNSSDITFTVRGWVKSADYWDVFFELNRRTYTELPQRGFVFAYPHMDVNVLNN